MREQSVALIGTEALEPTTLTDPHRLHETTSLDLAETGERLEDRQHLHLADGLVVLGTREKLRQGDGPHLELLLHLGPLAADLGGLVQRRLALLRGQCRRLRHAGHHSALVSGGHPPGTGVEDATSATTAAAMDSGSSAAVTARPMTRMSAPAAIAAAGVAARAWSSGAVPDGRMPGTTVRSPGAARRVTPRAAAAQTSPPHPAAAANLERAARASGGASVSLVRMVTPSTHGVGAPAAAA